MSDEAAFLAAMRAAPDDAAPRLIYADWLDERGDSGRAEFLRVECQLAGIGPDDDRRWALLGRLQAAGRGLDADWVAAVRRAAIQDLERRFHAWCEARWVTYSSPGLPCVLAVSHTCAEQARVVAPRDDGWDYLVRVAAHYHPELSARYHTGQVEHRMPDPAFGSWHVLWHLGMLYIDVQPHPVPTRARRAVPEPE